MRTKIAVMGAVVASALAWSPVASADTAAPAATSALVVVHIDSPEPVDLEQRGDHGWQVVCSSPCDKAVTADLKYRINGSGVRSSRAFHIDPGSRTTLAVQPGS